jgi:hypothetical protein
MYQVLVHSGNEDRTGKPGLSDALTSVRAGGARPGKQQLIPSGAEQPFIF